jgi:hypothetical protein
VLTDECRAELRALADLVPTAIVSGRRIERVVSFIKLQQLFYAGSHGLDIQVPSRRCARCSSECGGGDAVQRGSWGDAGEAECSQLDRGAARWATQGPLAGNYKLANPEQCSYQPAAAYFSTMNTLNDELREQMKVCAPCCLPLHCETAKAPQLTCFQPATAHCASH